MSVSAVTARSASTTSGAFRRFVVAALVAGFVLRLAFAFGYWVGKPLTLDEQEYLQLGASIANGHGLRYAGEAHTRHFERPPGFAAFVAGVFAVSGAPGEGGPLPRSSSDVPASIKIAQSLLGVLGIALIAAIAAQAAGRAAAAAAAALAAIYPPLVWICGYVLSEPLYSALALAVVWLLNAPLREGAGAGSGGTTDIGSPATGAGRLLARLFVAGVVAGAAVLTKEAMVFFVPLASVWLLSRKRLVGTLLFCAGVALVLTPWIAHNYAVYGRFVLTAPHGGVTFWTGNNPLSPGEGDLAANPEMGRARVAFEERHAGTGTQDLDAAYYQEAFSFVRHHPAQWAALVTRKFFYTFVPIGPSYRLHSAVYFGASLVSYGLVFMVGTAGLWRLVRLRVLGRAWAMWLLATSTILMSLVFFPQERFRIPVLDPTLVVAAGTWFGSLGTIARFFPGQSRSEGLD